MMQAFWDGLLTTGFRKALRRLFGAPTFTPSTPQRNPELAMRRLVLTLPFFLAPAALSAQQPASTTPARIALTTEQQVAAASLALPTELRAGATVLGYDAAGKLGRLHAGTNGMICLAPNPASPRFQSACYHESLEPFMARGRELRAQGVTGDKVDTVRFAEIKAGKLAMPKQPAALYQLTGPADSYDPAANAVKGAQPLYVIYINGATGAT